VTNEAKEHIYTPFGGLFRFPKKKEIMEVFVIFKNMSTQGKLFSKKFLTEFSEVSLRKLP
jgi:hypothetical protein